MLHTNAAAFSAVPGFHNTYGHVIRNHDSHSRRGHCWIVDQCGFRIVKLHVCQDKQLAANADRFHSCALAACLLGKVDRLQTKAEQMGSFSICSTFLDAAKGTNGKGACIPTPSQAPIGNTLEASELLKYEHILITDCAPGVAKLISAALASQCSALRMFVLAGFST